MDNHSDIVLLLRIKENDQEALEKLFQRYYYRLCDFVFQYVRRVDLAEEAVSDVFLKIWKNRYKIDISTNFKAYIYRAARNQALNYIQKEQKNWEPLEDMLPVKASGEYHPDEELIFQELEKHIEVLINKLPPRRKLIFKLSRIEGFTYREIADILSISIHTVQNQMVKAVKKLGSYAIAN
ncbi:MAG: RNA polymerase sigma-70 factor [Balneolaceae bacterium]